MEGRAVAVEITVKLTPDELGNTLSALEEWLTQLELAEDPPEDQAEVIESVKSALSKVNLAGYDALGFSKGER